MLNTCASKPIALIPDGFGFFMDSYVCPVCKSIVSSSRKEVHELYWCTLATAHQNADDSSSEENTPLSEATMGGARACMSALFSPEIQVSIGALPGLGFTLEQTNIFGALDTAGALWYVDRVMAEYIALTYHGQKGDAVALVLGCGGVPLSGLVASVVGFRTLLTDLEVALAQMRRNVDRNLGAIRVARSTLSVESTKADIRVRELPFGDNECLVSTLEEAGFINACGHDGRPETKLLVLCSDCIWLQHLHGPLLDTLLGALRIGATGASALIAYQTRNLQIENAFLHELYTLRAADFKVESVDLKNVFGFVAWPPGMKEALLADGSQLCEHFKLHEVTLRS